jgi:lysozyme family protein
MTPFDLAIEQTLGFEGATSNSVIDRGGFTHRGFTQGLYDRWRRAKGRKLQPVVLIDDDEVREIASEWFWMPCHCDEMRPELALAVFDMAFNSGQDDAIRALQIAVGATPDGKIGPKTLAAAQASDSMALLRFLKARGAHIQETIADDPPQLGNLEGWINRLLEQAWRTR